MREVRIAEPERGLIRPRTLVPEQVPIEQQPVTWRPEEDTRPTTQPRVPLGRLFAAVVAVETVYLLLRSIASLARLSTDSPVWLWLVVIVSAVLWPLTFGWAAYVLWRPKIAESRREALFRTFAVWVIAIVNLLLILALIDRPEMVLRRPI